MIVCIPSIGDKVEVTQDWAFHLEPESRNVNAMKHFIPTFQLEYKQFAFYELGDQPSYHEYYYRYGKKPGYKKYPVTLKPGTVLTVDRIYLRKGKEDFDSITFVLNKPKGVKGPMIRFWVRLPEVNAAGLKLVSNS